MPIIMYKRQERYVSNVGTSSLPNVGAVPVYRDVLVFLPTESLLHNQQITTILPVIYTRYTSSHPYTPYALDLLNKEPFQQLYTTYWIFLAGSRFHETLGVTRDNFPYDANTFSLIFTKRDISLRWWKSGGAILKLFQPSPSKVM